jgi:1-acyl-sn-glycerol-3-phosphate acyltransferase
MILLRAILYNLAFLLWTLILGVLASPLFLLAPRRVMARFGRFWARASLEILGWTVGLRHEVRGRENLPTGPAILALKHQSAWDTLFIACLVKDPAIVAKRELLLIPIFGWYLWRAGVIPIDRKAGASALRSIIARAKAATAQGRSIAIFPEGTRIAIGKRVPYQPGVAALYAQLGLPLVPVALNSGLFWPRNSFRKLPGRITLEILPPIPAGLDRRKVLAVLADRIETATDRLVEEAMTQRGEKSSVPSPARG